MAKKPKKVKLAGRNFSLPLLIIIPVGVIVVVLVLPFSMWYTSRPTFCTSCHEMEGNYSLWEASSHNSVNCEECHFEPGLIGFVKGKIGATKFVYIHFTRGEDLKVVGMGTPNSSCYHCHQKEYLKTLNKKVAENVNLISADLPPAAAYIRMEHRVHLEIDSIRCSDCHSRVVHAPKGQHRPKMTKGGCEECHNGTVAFSAKEEDNCVQCHQTKFDEQEVKGTDLTCYICHRANYIKAVNRKVVEEPRLLKKDGWQYINMNHELHLESDVGCLDCHLKFTHGVVDKARPDHEVCVNCHDDITSSDNCGSCHSGI